MSENIKKAILLVEDEALIARDEKLILEGYGYSVFLAKDGEAAIETVEKTPAIDLILMDIGLGTGKMDGTTAAEIILRTHDLPVVFLSSHASPEIVEKTERITSYGYIVKNSGSTVLHASMKMAFKLFESTRLAKSREKALRESEKKFRTLFNNAEAGMFRTRLDGSEFLDLNDKYLSIVGRTREELVGQPSQILWADPKEREEMVKILEAKGHVDGLEFRLLKKDGHVINCITSLRLYPEQGILEGSMINITEHKQAEALFQLERESFLELINNQPAGIYRLRVFPREQWREDAWNKSELSPYSLELVNDRFCEILGITRPFFEANPGFLIDLIHPEDKAEFAHKNEEANAKLIPFQWEGRLIAGGKICWVHFESLPRPAANGDVLWMGILYDITERNQAEAKIKALLLEKEILLKEVHHRIKNNMAAMMSLLSLQSKALKNPEAKAALLKAKERMMSMAVLYDKLYRSENIREMSLSDYLPRLIDEIVGVLPNREMVKVEKKIDDVAIEVQLLSPLGIIVNELITNAMKHAFIGKENGAINVTVSAKNGLVTLIVEDDGNGIPDSVDLNNTGGMGLELVSMLTAQIGGTIRIDRRKGARFVLEFDSRPAGSA